MEKVIDKLSSYNLLNNLLPGVVFCYLLKLINISDLPDGIIEKVFIYYFVGMIISRIGSVVVEPICKKLNLVQFSPYNDFIKASLKDDKVNILSETNNTYRTMLTVCLILLLIQGYLFIISKVSWLVSYMPFIVMFCLIILFAFSYRKQTSYVRNRVKHINETEAGGL